MNAPAPNPAPVVDVTAATFEKDVIERSREVPVLIDFWATWCGPCKTLGPILEKLAAEMSGRFVLAKIDTDAEPELSAAFRIQSVPTVLLVVDGRPADGFMGAQPEAQIRQFLEPHLGAAPGGAIDAALALAESGDTDGAIAGLRTHLRETPDDGAARLALVSLLLDAGRDDEAQKVVAKLTDEDWVTDAGVALRARLGFAEHRSDLDALRAAVESSPDDLDARLDLGRALVAAGEHEEGLEALVEVAKRDLRHDDGAPRKAMLEVFQMLGDEDPLTIEYQRRLSHLLCS
jgi:putative thioredoxin